MDFRTTAIDLLRFDSRYPSGRHAALIQIVMDTSDSLA
jgi:hypothetical protein